MKAVVVTVSDRVSRGEAEDRSGPAALTSLSSWGFQVESDLTEDGVEAVQEALGRWVGRVDLIVTTGGTGFGPRDLTPEATRPLLDRPAPGLAEAMRAATFGRNPHGMLSRGVAGIAGATLIVNLPGSERGAVESLDVIGPALEHAIRLLRAEPDEHH